LRFFTWKVPRSTRSDQRRVQALARLRERAAFQQAQDGHRPAADSTGWQVVQNDRHRQGPEARVHPVDMDLLSLLPPLLRRADLEDRGMRGIGAAYPRTRHHSLSPHPSAGAGMALSMRTAAMAAAVGKASAFRTRVRAAAPSS